MIKSKTWPSLSLEADIFGVYLAIVVVESLLNIYLVYPVSALLVGLLDVWLIISGSSSYCSPDPPESPPDFLYTYSEGFLDKS